MGESGDLALVLSGGGARAAYQVGVLRALARRLPHLRIPVVTGVSAGAINAVHLASRHDSFYDAVDRLADLWTSLTPQQVFQSDAAYLLGNALRWATRLVSGGSALAPRTRGLVDTAPLRRFLRNALDTTDGALPRIATNIEDGRLRAVGVSTTNYATGQSITWCQGRGFIDWIRPHRRSVTTTITLEHVMASTSIPLFFPAIELPDGWHGDGDIRLTAPLSPALHLGAGRIFAISARYRRSQREADEPGVVGYPPPAQVIGVLMNSIFLDNFDFDALQMVRINSLLENAGDRLTSDLRPVRLYVLRPSRDLGRIATEYESSLPRAFRFMTRGLGTRETRDADALSLLLFEREYVERLIALGEKDGEDQFEGFAALLED